MEPSRRRTGYLSVSVRIVGLAAAFGSCGLSAARAAPPRNIFGAHLLVDGLDGQGRAQLQWTRQLVGRWGHVKTLFMNVTAKTDGPPPHWKEFVAECYELELVPVIRLAGQMKQGTWVKPEPDAPGDYTSMARAIKRVVEGLPRSDACPLYIEVWNEPNLSVEWSGEPNPKEYAAFFVQAAAAIRSIGDKRIVILNGALALNADWAEQLCNADPAFVHAFDVWASHPYPMNRPPEVNLHRKTVKSAPQHTIDAYRLETAVLARHGRPDVKVMITETGYDLGNDVFTGGECFPRIDEDNRADYMVRAYRDYWSKWDEIVAVFPFIFAGQGWERFEWVYPDSGTNPDGTPTRPHRQYAAVAALAKPTDATGALVGRLTVPDLLLPIPGVSVTCSPGDHEVETDTIGRFYLGRLTPGEYRVRLTKPGFRAEVETVRVERARTAELAKRLAASASGKLDGKVFDGSTGQPLEGAELTFNPPTEFAPHTARDGSYDTMHLIPIAYTVTLAKDGYVTVVVPGVTAPVRSGRRQDFALVPRRGPDWPNELGNASFEESGGGGGRPGIGLRFEPLSPADCRITEKFAASGTRSQAIDAGAGVATVRQITHYNAAKPAKKYVASVWCRAENLTGQGAALSLQFTDNGGGVLQQIGPTKPVIGTTTGWIYMTLDAVAPPESKRVSVNLNVAPGKGTAYFDEAYLGCEP